MKDYERLRMVILGRRIGFKMGEIKEMIGIWEKGIEDKGKI